MDCIIFCALLLAKCQIIESKFKSEEALLEFIGESASPILKEFVMEVLIQVSILDNLFLELKTNYFRTNTVK